MCGIAGIISSGQPIKEDELTGMRDALAHRGPDGEGSWISPCTRVGFAHRRLAIIDFSASAAQPMLCRESGASIVFNGEIYNHRDLRAELEGCGVRFATDHSDTEVLLRGFLEWGIDNLLTRINGMFAFAIYDPRNSAVFIARDRVGIKPLYLARTKAGIVFGSEAKALLASGHCQPALDLSCAWHFLAFRSLPAPLTLFKGIEKLPPASYLRVSTDSLSETLIKYWCPLTVERPAPASWKDAQDGFEELLDDSIRLRMEADTKVGVFLSGGLDSTYVLDVASRNSDELSSFTARYPQHTAYDEGALATATARRLQSRHYDVEIDEESYTRALVDVAFFQDEPIAAPVCVPVYLLAAAARKADVPVVLAGEGSDEMLIGYSNWRRIRDVQRFLNLLPGWVSRTLASTVATGLGPIAKAGRVREVVGRAATGKPIFWGGAMDFTAELRDALAGPALGTNHEDTYTAVIDPIWREFSAKRDVRDVSGWMSYIDLRFRLPELMLPRLDKMGMAQSIEGRVPFLDHRLIEYIFSLPPKWRCGSGKEGKKIFKSVASRSLGFDFVYQKKRGFQAPVKEWRETTEFQRLIDALVRFSEKTALFDTEVIRRLLTDPTDRLYFTLVNFMLWYCLFIENVVEEELGDLTRCAAH